MGEEGQTFVKWVKKNQNKTTIHANGKTGLSIDMSTDCSKRACAKGACVYCYVEAVRSKKKLKAIDPELVKREGLGESQSPKAVVENDYRREIMHMPPDLVTAVNRDGGLRMFSFGDYRPRNTVHEITGEPVKSDFDNVKQMLDDAAARGLYVKAITKEKALLDDFGDHPNLRFFSLSFVLEALLTIPDFLLLLSQLWRPLPNQASDQGAPRRYDR